jgi:hypothetical protein
MHLDLKTRRLLNETLIASGEFGGKAVAKRVHVHDLHALALHLIGPDRTRLTYRHGGRVFRLTDMAGNLVMDILA